MYLVWRIRINTNHSDMWNAANPNGCLGRLCRHCDSLSLYGHGRVWTCVPNGRLVTRQPAWPPCVKTILTSKWFPLPYLYLMYMLKLLRSLKPSLLNSYVETRHPHLSGVGGARPGVDYIVPGPPCGKTTLMSKHVLSPYL